MLIKILILLWSIFKKADAQGNMYAPWNLGRMYENGWGVQKNLDMAKQWYEKAAGRGHPNAKNKLEELKKAAALLPLRSAVPLINQTTVMN